MSAHSRAILFYNKKSGQSKTGEQCEIIRAHFAEHKISLEIVVIPKPCKEIEEIVTQAIIDGVDLFLAAGGDGTVSLVANSLVGTGIPLGIIPLGTGNLLAKELNIPLGLNNALELITTDKQKTIKMDTFKCEDRNFILNLSVGVTSVVMEETDSEEKQRLGVIAYLIIFIQRALGLKLHRFYLEYDHQRASYLASEILITNGRSMGMKMLKWSEDVCINDGVLDMFIIRAANILDIFGILFSIIMRQEKMNPIFKTIQFKEYCRIETKTPMHTQADGDVFGETPVELQIQPGSLSVIIGLAD